MDTESMPSLELKEKMLREQITNPETMHKAKTNLVAFYRQHIAELLEMVSQFEAIPLENMTIELFKIYKKRMMVFQVFLPTAANHCYFCIDVHKHSNIDLLDRCHRCSYGNVYGVCDLPESNFKRLAIARSNLLHEIHKYYYEPEPDKA